MRQRIGFDQLNEGFDRLQDVATVRQVLVTGMEESGE